MAWHPIGCVERDVMFHSFDGSNGLRVMSSLTDLDGIYGPPTMVTEWCTPDDEPVLRDVRHPARGGEKPDVKPCEHYSWETQLPA